MRGEDADKPPLYVGTLTRAETDLACPRHGEVQSRTNAIAHLVTQEGGYDSPQRYGTEVHKRLAYVINGPGGSDFPRDLDFRAEYSLIKSKAADYGERGSIRVDVLERVNSDTVCVYDIKTGDRGLGAARMDEIAFNVNRLYPGTRRVIVIETRPR